MKKALIIGLLALVLLMSGCTSAPTTPQPTQTQPAMTTTTQATETPVMTTTIQATGTPAPTTTTQTTTAPAGVAVEIRGYAYNPLNVTISKGSTVTWTNNDSAPHTVTSVSGVFDSGSITYRGTFSYTFNQTGTFEYGCAIHTYIPHGNVTVT